MKNLAGNTGCDPILRQELQTAGIEIVEHDSPLPREVPASVTGQLTRKGEVGFTFTRAWYYWVVSGDVPLKVAKKMYQDPVGKKDIRVAGHCGCPPPEQWAFPKVDVLRKRNLLSVTFGELAEMCNRGEIKAPRFVSTYHIDSQKGLNLFVRTMKKHKLAD